MAQTVPTHIGIIVDGNRRWARAHNLPQLEGHRRGYGKLKDLGKYAINRGVKYMSAYIFSTENWNRSAEEVEYLMDLAYERATKDVDELDKEGIRVRWIGSRERISAKLRGAIEKAEAQTAGNDRGHLLLCFNYGGHRELVEAFQKMIKAGVKPGEVDEKTIARYLYAPDVPPVDLIIRTSGEQRISNFMLWRAAYAELYFVRKHFPDFGEEDLDAALADFASRDRRFGGDHKTKMTAETAVKHGK